MFWNTVDKIQCPGIHNTAAATSICMSSINHQLLLRRRRYCFTLFFRFPFCSPPQKKFLYTVRRYNRFPFLSARLGLFFYDKSIINRPCAWSASFARRFERWYSAEHRVGNPGWRLRLLLSVFFCIVPVRSLFPLCHTPHHMGLHLSRGVCVILPGFFRISKSTV